MARSLVNYGTKGEHNPSGSRLGSGISEPIFISAKKKSSSQTRNSRGTRSSRIKHSTLLILFWKISKSRVSELNSTNCPVISLDGPAMTPVSPRTMMRTWTVRSSIRERACWDLPTKLGSIFTTLSMPINDHSTMIQRSNWSTLQTAQKSFILCGKRSEQHHYKKVRRANWECPNLVRRKRTFVILAKARVWPRYRSKSPDEGSENFKIKSRKCNWTLRPRR